MATNGVNSNSRVHQAISGLLLRTFSRPSDSACLTPEINSNGAKVGLGGCLRVDYVLSLHLAQALTASYLHRKTPQVRGRSTDDRATLRQKDA
jgi:uncharacterized SAM-binding protein YcdF (DUF218 family)